jgi:hypothetical protein
MTVQVGHVYQRAGKPTHPKEPMPVVWDVLLFTSPHKGDICLESADPDFAAWAKSLNANDFVEIEFRPARK